MQPLDNSNEILIDATLDTNNKLEDISQSNEVQVEGILETNNELNELNRTADMILEKVAESKTSLDISINGAEAVEITGPQGEKGEMPVKGKDYFTPQEVAEITRRIQASIKVPNKIGYTFQAITVSGISILDGSITYIAGATVSTSYNGDQVIPKTGTIKQIYANINVFGTLGSSETGSLYMRINNTTDTLISSSVTLTAVSNGYSLTGQSISVTAGDRISYRFEAPTYATNPTNNQFSFAVYIE